MAAATAVDGHRLQYNNIGEQVRIPPEAFVKRREQLKAVYELNRNKDVRSLLALSEERRALGGTVHLGLLCVKPATSHTALAQNVSFDTGHIMRALSATFDAAKNHPDGALTFVDLLALDSFLPGAGYGKPYPPYPKCEELALAACKADGFHTKKRLNYMKEKTSSILNKLPSP